MRCLDTSAAVPEYVAIFLEPDLGLRPNVIRANHPTIKRGMRVQRHEHRRWLWTVDRDFKTYANEYSSLLSCHRTEIIQSIVLEGNCWQLVVKGCVANRRHNQRIIITGMSIRL